jgi:putative ABC transport system permease protein
LGAAFTAASYYVVISQGVMKIMITLGPGLLLNAVGTLLLFMSVSGFMLMLTQKNKRKYLSGLTMFTSRQLNSKVNTKFCVHDIYMRDAFPYDSHTILRYQLQQYREQ